MSKMSELSMTLDEMISYGNDMIKCGEGLMRIAKELKIMFSEESQTTHQETSKEVTKDVPYVETKSYSFTDVRSALATKSKEGFKEEIKMLIQKYGADKLSAIQPEYYNSLMKDVEELKHE